MPMSSKWRVLCYKASVLATQTWAISWDLRVTNYNKGFFTWTWGSTFFCWALSCASMLRSSCSILIKRLFEAGKIDEETKEKCLEYIMSVKNYEKIKNLIVMTLVPKKMHKNDCSQAAYLKAAVSRVRTLKLVTQITLLFRLRIQQYLKTKVHWCYTQSMSFFSMIVFCHCPINKFRSSPEHTEPTSLLICKRLLIVI